MKLLRQLQANDLLARVDTIVATDMDGETMMMSVETGKYFHLDDIATSVWAELEQPRTLDQVVDQLQASYDVDADQCRNDTLELIEKLLEYNVLRTIST